MTVEEIKAMRAMLAKTRDEYRQLADWMRTQDLDRGIQRVPTLVLRLSSMADELLLTVERYARRMNLWEHPEWKLRGFASWEEALKDPAFRAELEARKAQAEGS